MPLKSLEKCQNDLENIQKPTLRRLSLFLGKSRVNGNMSNNSTLARQIRALYHAPKRIKEYPKSEGEFRKKTTEQKSRPLTNI